MDVETFVHVGLGVGVVIDVGMRGGRAGGVGESGNIEGELTRKMCEGGVGVKARESG